MQANVDLRIPREMESRWLGGRGIHISSQLGHLPGTGGGQRTTKGMGGTPRDQLFQL